MKDLEEQMKMAGSIENATIGQRNSIRIMARKLDQMQRDAERDK
jgi:hypothetical protein